MSGEIGLYSLIYSSKTFSEYQQKKFIILGRFWLLLCFREEMGFSESLIKKEKRVTKIFFTIMLNEKVLKSCEKLISADDVKINEKQL